MPNGPIKTVFTDYVGEPLTNKGDSAGYDDWSGLAPGDSATSTALGDLLTSVHISGAEKASKKSDVIY